VTRVLIGQRGKLIREAIAAVLSQADDIAVLDTASRGDELIKLAQQHPVDLTVLDVKLPSLFTVSEVCEKLTERCAVLLLTDPEIRDPVYRALARMVPRIGFLATECSPETLVDSVRRIARGEAVIDTRLALTFLIDGHNPLTDRERDVLIHAAEGLSAPEIGRRLFLSPGTIRNHLSRVMTKTGTRSRIAAIRTAQENGWI